MKLPLPLYCALVNFFRFKLRNRPCRIAPVTKEIFSIEDTDQKVFFCRRSRYRLYKPGVMRRLNDLAKVYQLDKIPCDLSGGVFIDCGANVGELGFWARANNMEYIAFEPEPLEARCCDLNNFGGEEKTHRKALWKETGTVSFFRKPESADSSLYEMAEFDEETTIDAVTLESAIDISQTDGPVILKVEAEGAEPEVLLGAQKLMSEIDYVAIDCGYERGFLQAHTFIEANEFMLAHGFELIAAEFKRVCFLYAKSYQ